MMQRILGATPEDRVAHIAKEILIATRTMPKLITEELIVKTSESKQFDSCTPAEIREAVQMLIVAVEEAKNEPEIGTVEAVQEEVQERKDVTVKVTHLNIENETEEDAKARKVIEEEIIPKLANGLVYVVVLYMPKMESAKNIVRRADVLPYANSVIASAEKKYGKVDVKDFALIEFDIIPEEVLLKMQEAGEKSAKIQVGDVRVTQLSQ